MRKVVPEPLHSTPITHRYIGPHLETGWRPATRHTDGVVGASGDIVLTLDDYRALRTIQRLSSPPSRDTELGRFVDSDVLGRRAAVAGPGAQTANNAIDVLESLVRDYFLPSIAGLEDETLRCELQDVLESASEPTDNVGYAVRLDGAVVDRCINETNYYAGDFPEFRNLSPTFRVRHSEALAETDDPQVYIAKVRAAVGELLDARFPGLVVTADEEGPGVRVERAVVISVAAGTDAPLCMEDAGLVSRAVFAEVPPRVEYALTPLGHGAAVPLAHLRNWVNENVNRPHLDE